MKYGDAVLLGGFSLLGIPVLGQLGIVPYRFSIAMVALAAIGGFVYWKDPNFLKARVNTSNTLDRTVPVNEELDYIQEEIQNISGYRRLDLDRTSRKNMQLHTDTLTVTKNGQEHEMFGVVARPTDQHDKESICYILDCNTGQLTYDGERTNSEERMNPFHGTKWVENAGYRAKKKGENTKGKPGGVNIYQGSPKGEKQ